MEIKIIGMNNNGEGIGKIDGMVVFVPKTIIGDIVEIEIVRKHKNYLEGRVIKYIKRYENYLESKCPYYNLCGGCSISDLSYKEQLDYKIEKVTNIFSRQGIEINLKILPSKLEYAYRNKITLHVIENKLGLMDINNNLIEIDECFLVSDKINDVIKKIKNLDLHLVREIIIKDMNNGLMLLVDGKMDISSLYKYFNKIYMNDKLVFDNKECILFIGDLVYQVSDKSFFQINTCNIGNLYEQIVKYGNFSKEDNVIDLYCGVGSISLYIAKYVNKVLGIEIVDSAVCDAKVNALKNNIHNVEFILSSVDKIVDKKIKDYNKIIVDPPRIGLDKKTINVLNDSNINNIIYVSCNPMTLIRDIKLLDNYFLKDIILVDMFPQTYHVECVCILKLR